MSDVVLQPVLQSTTWGLEVDKINANEIALRDNKKFGTDTNYHEFKENGTRRAIGTATAWKDMVADLFGRRLSSTSGRVDYEWNENAIKFQSGGNVSLPADRVGGNLEINHEFKVGSGIIFRPHIHWFQENTTEYEITFKYRLQRNGQAKTTAWTTVVTNLTSSNATFEYTSGTLNQISELGNITIDCGISDTIQFQMARTDSLGGDVLVYFMDIHGEVDSDGSDTEYTKA